MGPAFNHAFSTRDVGFLYDDQIDIAEFARVTPGQGPVQDNLLRLVASEGVNDLV
jgi:hypothetical protein